MPTNICQSPTWGLYSVVRAVQDTETIWTSNLMCKKKVQKKPWYNREYEKSREMKEKGIMEA